MQAVETNTLTHTAKNILTGMQRRAMGNKVLQSEWGGRPRCVCVWGLWIGTFTFFCSCGHRHSSSPYRRCCVHRLHQELKAKVDVHKRDTTVLRYLSLHWHVRRQFSERFKAEAPKAR